MTFIIGIDDAGRGPILGPMVLAGVLIEEADNEKLKEWGVKDSKQVNKQKREELAEKIRLEFKFHIEITYPEEIDSRTKIGTDLNRIEAVKAALIINNLIKSMPKNKEKIKVIIDCPSPNTQAWKKYLGKHVEKKELVEIHAEHKADINHPSCSAASIIAKTTRDGEMENIKQQIIKELGFEVDPGSGYASDKITQKFLEEHAHKIKSIKIIRESWQTWTNIQAKKQQKKLF